MGWAITKKNSGISFRRHYMKFLLPDLGYCTNEFSAKYVTIDSSPGSQAYGHYPRTIPQTPLAHSKNTTFSRKMSNFDAENTTKLQNWGKTLGGDKRSPFWQKLVFPSFLGFSHPGRGSETWSYVAREDWQFSAFWMLPSNSKRIGFWGIVSPDASRQSTKNAK